MRNDISMKAVRITNGIILAFVALNAFGGGYYGMSGAPNVPLEWLEGSPFTSYFLPGLFLFTVIGGVCTVGAIAVFGKSRYERRISFVCGLLLTGWIIAQVAIIGYVSWMQPAIFISGVVILIAGWLLPKPTA
jgi:hypothetical protein